MGSLKCVDQGYETQMSNTACESLQCIPASMSNASAGTI